MTRRPLHRPGEKRRAVLYNRGASRLHSVKTERPPHSGPSSSILAALYGIRPGGRATTARPLPEGACYFCSSNQP
jgi:hypothetical protein